MIDKESHVPIYLQIERILTQQIEQGILHPGDSIPSETVLAEQYQVSRMTARKAVDYLVRQAWWKDSVDAVHLSASQHKSLRWLCHWIST
ncbi:predicted transcriptional regulator of N-acetylglucosamine utilization GntR family [Vibrio ponticus]|nr:predicted transcriptional regulator of N-acetylglucosamine utilization GntR family [Vibrio ponticus]